MPNNYFEIILDGSIDSNSGQLDKCIACTFEGLDCRGGFKNQTHQAASSSRLVHEPLRFHPLSQFSQIEPSPAAMGDLAPPPGAPGIPFGSLLEVLPALHSSFLFLPFSARSMCVCLVVISFVMFCQFSGLVGWLCQLPFLFQGFRACQTPLKYLKIISNFGEIS